MQSWTIWLLIILGILLLVGLGALSYYILKRHYAATPNPPIPNPPTINPNPPSPVPSNPPSPVPSNPPAIVPANPPPPVPSNPPPPVPSNPPPPPVPPCPQYYSLSNVNFNGNDLKGSPHTAANEGDCQTICTDNPDCLFYNFEPGKSSGNCWIKNANATPGYQLGFNIPNQPGYNCPEFMAYLGAEIKDKPVGSPSSYSGGSLQQCQTNCENEGCHFYTYNANGQCSLYQFAPKSGTNTGVNLDFASSSIPAGTPIWNV